MKSSFIFNDISTFLLKKKVFNFYTNIVGTIRLKYFRSSSVSLIWTVFSMSCTVKKKSEFSISFDLISFTYVKATKLRKQCLSPFWMPILSIYSQKSWTPPPPPRVWFSLCRVHCWLGVFQTYSFEFPRHIYSF